MWNLSGLQVILIILAVIFVLWLIGWWINRSKKQSVPISPTHTNPPVNSPIISPIDHMNPYTLYYFYIPGCKWCEQFNPEWRQASEMLANVHGLNLQAIDASKPENERLVFYYNISAFPAIILVTPEQDVQYEGDRTANELYAFVEDKINQYHTTHQN